MTDSSSDLHPSADPVPTSVAPFHSTVCPTNAQGLSTFPRSVPFASTAPARDDHALSLIVSPP
eukprot:CAMPEP_0182459274 /NCGR_PEP_ID=MMETSP1319-20130603/4436_1 /TAXON_ID=172717 /ORGANISM="Bolidomonas pacifica, Strain RCC208" /LENGTH=62 /DNA_ID=CAMNT_0024658149 /DNA_START=453 /DNA_END=641 /DNA_ORIENTATION=-